MREIYGVDANECNAVQAKAHDGCLDKLTARLTCLDQIHYVASCLEELTCGFGPEVLGHWWLGRWNRFVERTFGRRATDWNEWNVFAVEDDEAEGVQRV